VGPQDIGAGDDALQVELRPIGLGGAEGELAWGLEVGFLGRGEGVRILPPMVAAFFLRSAAQSHSRALDRRIFSTVSFASLRMGNLAKTRFAGGSRRR
jgi:hypothetical protein